MLPDRLSNPGPLTYESGAIPIALCGTAQKVIRYISICTHSVRLKLCSVCRTSQTDSLTDFQTLKKGALVAKLVKRCPTDIAVPDSSPTRGGKIFQL